MGVEAELLTRHIPYDKVEYDWARWRPVQHRTPIPAIGDKVLYRAMEWAAPTGARVLEVDELVPPGHVPASWPIPNAPPYDPNCWRVRTDPGTAQPVRTALGGLVIDRHPDWWPTLLLKVDGLPAHVQAREARLRGSAGWLPLDWMARARPVPGYPLPGMPTRIGVRL